MTAAIYNIRDFKRKEEKPEPSLDQIEAEIMSELLGVPPCYLIDDYYAPAEDPA